MIESLSEDGRARGNLHAVLVRVIDTGVLLIGESGIGKSECALDLINRGHRLVADDVVEVFVRENKILGKASDLTRHLLEIRGLGTIDVLEIFDERAVLDETEIDLCVELREWIDTDPLGDPVSEFQIAGRVIPKFVLPVNSTCNLTTLVETVTRLYRNGGSGKTAERLIEQHTRLLRSVH